MLLLSFISCETKEEHPLSPEFEEVSALIQTDPETALSKLQNLSNSANKELSSLEYSILLAEALYKNYLPQSNFDDIKAIVDYIETEKTTPNYLRAKAHYYHAVGLTERDDIAGTCEHYLKALEILSEIKNPDYEQTRFIFLTYTRLGELFLKENYGDIAIVKFKHALKYAKLLDNKLGISNTLKLIGNTYHINLQADSALYYFNKSLDITYNPINKLDVEKSIAHILFENGEKDSAYIMLKNNLDKIEDYGAKHSYYTLLGEFYYHDNKYDSAICYLEQGLESQFFYTKLNASIRLSSIYDSLNNNSKKAYYDKIISQLSIDKIEKNSDNLKLQNIYDEYKERKYEREKLNNKNSYIYSTIAIIIVIIILTVVSIFRNKQKNIRFSNLLKDKENIIKQISKEIQQKENYIKSLEFKQSLTEGKIKNNNTKLHNQEELIKNYQLEIIELKKQLEKNISCISNLNGYYQSEICFQILKQIEKLSEKNIDTSRLNALKQEEFVLLLKSANIFLNDIFNDMANKYPKLKKEDLYYLCLVIINLNDKQISSLFGVSYNSIKIRKRKICSIFDIRTDEINIFLSNKL